MKLQTVPAPKFQMFQEVAIKPEGPLMIDGEIVMIDGEIAVFPQPERGVIVGMSYWSESMGKFFGEGSRWSYQVDGDFEMTPEEAATAEYRWDLRDFSEDELTLIQPAVMAELVPAVELVAA